MLSVLNGETFKVENKASKLAQQIKILTVKSDGMFSIRRCTRQKEELTPKN